MPFMWMNFRKFCFIFSLKTGVKMYGFISYMMSILITNILIIKMVDQQICGGIPGDWSSKDDKIIRCYATKQIIISQACQAFMSALMLLLLKIPAVPLCWIGCKFVLSIMELGYLPDWSREVFFQFYNIYLDALWFAVIFIGIDLYGVLVVFGYYNELTGTQSLNRVSSKKSITNGNVPSPPDLPIL